MSFHIKTDMYNYFDFDKVWYDKEYNLFYLNLISKATGEIIEFPMESDQFDTLLKEMETNIKKFQDTIQFLKAGLVVWRNK